MTARSGKWWRRGRPPAVLPEPIPAPEPEPAVGTAVERLAARCVEAIAALGGEASSVQIRERIEAGGTAVAPNRISEALNVLARRDPSPVARAGPRHPGRGRPGMWRLAGETTGPGGTWELSWEQTRTAARNMRALRAAGGLRQGDLAKAAGLAQSTISGYERAAVRMPADQAQAIARALGTTAEALTGEAGP